MNPYVEGTLVLGCCGASVVGQSPVQYDVWRDRFEAIIIGLVTGMTTSLMSQSFFGRRTR